MTNARYLNLTHWWASLIFGLLLLAATPQARADVSAGDRTAIQTTIESQIMAFQADDAETAYSFAAPMIQRLFPTPGRFMEMVKRGYQPVYRPKSYVFEDTVERQGQVIQKLSLIGPDGKAYTALYTLRKQDGAWRITGVQITEAPGADA